MYVYTAYSHYNKLLIGFPGWLIFYNPVVMSIVAALVLAVYDTIFAVGRAQ